MRKAAICVLGALLALLPGVDAPAAERIADNLHKIELRNGMEVFFYPRRGVPLFSGLILVDAGAVDEEAGATGLAHLLEHMAFKGTPWVGTRDWVQEKDLLEQAGKAGAELTRERRRRAPDTARVDELTSRLAALQKKQAELVISNEYDQLLTREGAQDLNATTGKDFTKYFVTLPANKLELWAMMESQRLLYPSWREFYTERDVVAEERRMRVDDSPVGTLYETFIATSFLAHPYRSPVIGWMHDIQGLTVETMDGFYRKWYVPGNMIAVLAGDLQLPEVQAVMEKYFGSIPSRPLPVREPTREPEQKGERRVTVRFDAQPQVIFGWHKPALPHKDAYVVEVIQYLLTRAGRSSRLYERLVKQDAVCVEVDSFTAPGEKYDNMFVLWLIPRAPHTTRDAELAAMREVARLRKEPVPDEELAKIRNQIDAGFLKDLESNLGFAQRFAEYYAVTRDPQVLDKLREEMKAVTAQDIMRVAQTYLADDKRTVAELLPVGAPDVRVPLPPGPIPTDGGSTATASAAADTTAAMEVKR